MLTALWIVLGLALLVTGGDVVVRGAGQLALAAGVRPLVVGLTVVAFSTSAPELAASTTAALAGSPGLAVGNVLGSNIANIGLILALSALVRPVDVQSTVLTREVPVMIGATALTGALASDGTLGRADGALLLVALGLYLALMLRMELRAREPAVEAEVVERVEGRGGALRSVGRVLGGAALLVVGADRLVLGATELARAWGLSEAVVGLTVMAVGTSLPELAASLAAARRGEGDLVLGNVVGSNIFNLLCILGITVLVQPIEGAMDTFRGDLWVTLGFALILWPMLGRTRRVFRAEAALLLVLWGGYTWSLV